MKYLLNIEHFSHQEEFSQVSQCAWLLISFSGLEDMSANLPSGKQFFSISDNKAFAALVPKGSCCNFSYGDGRDNWVLKLEEGILSESRTGVVELSWSGMTCELPGFAPLNVMQVDRCTEYLIRLLRAFHSPEQEDSISLFLAFSALLDCVVDPMQNPPHIEDPAASLHDMIITDRRFTKNLFELSSACGYSPDHIRFLFISRYGVTPKSFRTDYRMRLAKDLLALGTLTVQEVSDQLGYSYTAHFSTAFKKHFGSSPRSVLPA